MKADPSPPAISLHSLGQNHAHGVDPQRLREINRWVILNALRTQGPSSRTRLTKQTRLSATTLTSIVRELVEQQWIKEIGSLQAEQNARWSGGRQAIEVAFNARAGAVIGGQIGRTELRLLLTDLTGHCLKASEPIKLETAIGPDRYLPQLLAALDDFVRGVVTWEQVFGIGLGIPGPLDNTFRPNSPPGMSAWDGRDIVAELAACAQGTFNPRTMPIYLENEAKFGALGESWYGAGRSPGRDNVAYVKVGSGVGAGFVLQRQLYRGNTGTAGELGHSRLDRGDSQEHRVCACGKVDCLEAYTSVNGILQDVRAITGEAGLTIERVIERAKIRADGQISADAIELAGRRLGAAIGSLINMLDPAVVVIDGQIPQHAGDLLLHPLIETAREHSFHREPLTSIELSSLEGYAIAWGGVAKVIDTLFLSPPLPTARPLRESAGRA
ncbi:MAG TPA: ROK family protein [Ktedonobacterales bacterium]|jgi:predicted NBD/HSP70 family sugar kinase